MTWFHGNAFPASVAVGRANFTQVWVARHGKPPDPLILGREDGTGTLTVLHPNSAIQPDNTMDIAISEGLFQKIAKPGEDQAAPVRFRAAGFWSRAWHLPGTRLDLLVAFLALLAAVGIGAGALINGLVRQASPGAPLWLLIVVFVIICATSTAKLVQDIRKADQSNT
jgi:hypothetical protein